MSRKCPSLKQSGKRENCISAAQIHANCFLLLDELTRTIRLWLVNLHCQLENPLDSKLYVMTRNLYPHSPPSPPLSPIIESLKSKTATDFRLVRKVGEKYFLKEHFLKYFKYRSEKIHLENFIKEILQSVTLLNQY